VEWGGLKGGGGAGFTTAVKMRAVAAGRRRSVVVANGTEGEPASRKDKALLTESPHVVLDGVGITAETVGAAEAIICIDRHAAGAIRSVVTALEERHRVGLGRIPVRVEMAPSAYVAGEVPELTARDDWGYPAIDPRPVPGALRPHVRHAVAARPAAALLLRNADEPTAGPEATGQQ
jgi:Na+-translocating ferredoxin:NAD+ oxidoreductase RnfC subunit